MPLPFASFARKNTNLFQTAGGGLLFDLPYQKPKKRRKKRIPQEVLDEWRLWSRPKTPKANESPEGPDAAMDTSNVAARNPLTGELDSGRVSDSDSLDGEVWGADMNPFDGEAWAGLDDPD